MGTMILVIGVPLVTGIIVLIFTLIGPPGVDWRIMARKKR